VSQRVHAMLPSSCVRLGTLRHRWNDARDDEGRFPLSRCQLTPPYDVAAGGSEEQSPGDQRSADATPWQGDVNRRERLHVSLESLRDRLGKRHIPQLAALGRREDRLTPTELELLRDVQHLAVEVEGIHEDAQDLALPKSASRTKVNHRPIAFGQRFPNREHPIGKPRRDPLTLNGRRLDRRSSERRPRQV
jgi:hypothetical protein